MLYICDPSDHRQEFRCRLYRYWYEKFNRKEEFTLKDSSIQMEKITIYAGLFLKKTNPAYKQIIEAFDVFVNLIPYDRSSIVK